MVGKLKHLDWLFFLPMLILIVIGTIAIWSAGNARAELIFHGMWKDSLVTAGIGLLLYFVLAFIDYRKVLEILSVPAYCLSIVLLLAVLVFGSSIYGGRRWLWFFQPSEISKLCVIMLFAQWQLKDSFTGFLKAMVALVLPALLILAEPDLGTTLTLVPTIVIMMLLRGVWRRGLLIMIFVGGILSMLLLGMIYEAEKPGVSMERHDKIMKFVPLKNHQVRRVKVFLFPEEDIKGAGYNLRQAKISIGSGGFAGKGIGKGETNHLKYLPPAISMNDFIFCVYAEETGFIGSVALLSLFAVLFIAGTIIAVFSDDDRGRLLAMGVVSLIFMHVFINIAMSIGVVPITGLPLPFISSGRTFLITIMCGLGFVQSVKIHKE